MSGAEAILRRLWVDRVKLARPRHSDKDIQIAVDSIMRDPTGGYANEIKAKAERVETSLWVAL